MRRTLRAVESPLECKSVGRKQNPLSSLEDVSCRDYLELCIAIMTFPYYTEIYCIPRHLHFSNTNFERISCYFPAEYNNASATTPSWIIRSAHTLSLHNTIANEPGVTMYSLNCNQGKIPTIGSAGISRLNPVVFYYVFVLWVDINTQKYQRVKIEKIQSEMPGWKAKESVRAVVLGV